MKPKEYVKKFKLDESPNFNRNEFIADFSTDFITVIELLSSRGNFGYERFKHCIKEVRQKWDGISNKMGHGGLPEPLWKYFYATVVCKLRDSLFGEYLKQKHEAHLKRQKQWEEMHAWEDRWEKQEFDNFYQFMFSGLLKALSQSYINDCFSLLKLEPTQDKEVILSSYRKLSLDFHPDKGGDKDKFIKLTEAKNKCLMYANK